MRRAPFLLILIIAGCSNNGAVQVPLAKKPVPGKPVATYAGEQISVEELNSRFADMNPVVRARYQTVDQRREYVEGLVRYELLAREAARRGLQNDPEVADTFKKVLVQKLIRTLEDEVTPASKEEVAAYYAKHRSDYVKPGMTRLSHIFLKQEDRPKAQALLEQAKQLNPLDYAAFAALARDNSQDPRTQPIEGDMRFLNDEELARQYGPEVVDAAKALQQVGQVHPTLVETKDGVHVLKLQGRQVALNLDLAAVTQNIESILQNERKMLRYKQFLEKLNADAKLQLDPAALGQVVVDPRAPAPSKPAPAPGFVPAPVLPRQAEE